MAVKQDTRQKLLFANDDFQTIEAGKVCTKCNQFKSVSEFYTVKRKNGEFKKVQSNCKQCENKRRTQNLRKQKLPGYVSQEEIWRRARIEKEKLQQIDQCIREIPEATQLESVALREFQKLKNRSRTRMRDCWTRKSDSVLSGLKTRDTRNINRDKRLKGVVDTWMNASEKQFRLLNSRTTARLASEWYKKATRTVADHRWRCENDATSNQNNN